MNGCWNHIIFKVFYSIYKEQDLILQKSNRVYFMKIACRKYKITILKIQLVQNISFTSLALSSQNISVNVKTGQQNRTILQVSDVKYNYSNLR